MEAGHLSELISQYGNHASIALLDPRTHLFKGEKVPGILGYQVHRGCIAVYGDPVCQKCDAIDFFKEFTAFTDTAKLGTCFVTSSHDFTHKLCQDHPEYKKLKVGKELIVNTFHSPAKGASGRGLKNRLNLAKRAGVVLHEYKAEDPTLRKEIEGVKQEWLKNRKGPQIFLSSIDLFETLNGKRLFYASCQEEIVGALQLQKLGPIDGYLVQILMAKPSSPAGTSESLMMHAIETLRTEGIQSLSLGAAITPTLDHLDAFHPLFRWSAQKIFNFADKLFRLSHKEFFWSKFRPEEKDLYLISNNFSLAMLLSLKNALNVSLWKR